jgi:hypothetical protein
VPSKTSCTDLLGAFLPLSELVRSAKPRISDKPTSEVLRRHPMTFFPSKIAEIVRLCVNPVRRPAEFPGILHGQYCSRGTSRGSRLHPVKSRDHGVLHGVDVPAREEPREVPRLLARFPCDFQLLTVSFYKVCDSCINQPSCRSSEKHS